MITWSHTWGTFNLFFSFFHKLHFWVLSTPSPHKIHPDWASVENFHPGMFETQDYLVSCCLREEFYTGDVFSLRHDTFNNSSSFLDRLKYANPTSVLQATCKHKSELWFVVTLFAIALSELPCLVTVRSNKDKKGPGKRKLHIFCDNKLWGTGKILRRSPCATANSNVSSHVKR